MKKRGFFILLALLITVEAVTAQSDDLVFSDTITHKENRVIEGKDFDFRVTNVGVSVDIDGQGIIVDPFLCKLKNNFNICISNVTFAYKNLTTYEYIYKALVKIYLKKSALTITKNVNGSFLVGESKEIELKLENTANIPAENVVLTDKYPSEILVSEVEGCILKFNTVTFNGPIGPEKTRTCTYKITGLKPTNFTSKVEASYFNGLQDVNLTVSSLINILGFSLEVKLTKDKENIMIGDEVKLYLSLKNTNQIGDLKVTSLILEVPRGYIIQKKPKEMSLNNNMISWSGKLGNESDFTIDLKAARSGKQKFNLDYSYTVANFLREFNESHEINIDCNCPYIDYQIGNLVPGLKTDFKISIINLGSINFRNLKVDYDTNIPGLDDYSTAYGEINKNSIIEILNKRIQSPAEGESYYFNINIAYESSFNQFFTQKKSLTIPLTSGSQLEEPEIIEVENLNESEIDEKIDVESNDADSDITNQTSDSEEGNETILDPIIIEEEKTKISLKALSIIGFILVLIVIFVIIMAIKGKKKEPDLEIPPELE